MIASLWLSWCVIFESGAIGEVRRATGGWVTGNLVAGVATTAGVLAIVCGAGRLRLADVGVRGGDVARAVAVAAAIWLVAQPAHALASLIAGDEIAAASWQGLGWGRYRGPDVLAHAIGVTPGEELAFRGVLLVQAALLVPGGPRARWLAAIAISQTLFGLWHIPARLDVGLGGLDLVANLAATAAGGVAGAIAYLRTRNLALVALLHALWNTPAPLVASPVHPSIVAVGLGAIVVAAWPRRRSGE
jgi:hypothetical protein